MAERAPSGERLRAGKFGRRAEWRCAWLLRLKGYRVLARNLRLAVGEVDLIARRGDTLAFVEVKARATLEEAAAALGARQRQRIARAASAYLGARPALAHCSVRFDVMLVGASGLPRHLIDAWRPEA